MKKMIHVVEGTTMNIEMEGGERVVTFAADIVDDWVEMNAKELHELMKSCALGGDFKPTEEDIQKMMDAGSNTFVVEHIGENAMMHFIKKKT